MEPICGNVEVGGVAFHRCTKRKDNLFDSACRYAGYKRVYFKVGRAYTVHGRYYSSQDVIETFELTGSLYSHYFAYILDYTNGSGVASRVGADIAHIGVADIMAHTAIAYVVAQAYNGITEVVGSLLILS